MKLSEIINKINKSHEIKGDPNIEIQDIAIDSRLINPDQNSIFFALKGIKNDGEKYIENAIKNGAKVIISNNFDDPKVTTIKTDDVFALLVEFLHIFYPNLPQNIYAITGTNGKTSTAEFLRQILGFLGKNAASIGTMGINCDEKIKPQLQQSELTTPNIVSLYKNLAILKKNGVNDVAIETSSIGLKQNRIKGLEITSAAFTNFSIDHLDYHQNMEEYFACKMLLFKEITPEKSHIIVNSDIEEFSKIQKICQNKNHQIIDYGFNAKTLKINEIKQNGDFSFTYNGQIHQCQSQLAGDFQIFNLICALGLVLSKYSLNDSEISELTHKFSQISPALGRMQKITEHNDAQIFIDFAHSPDALRNVLENARKLNPGRLLVLFGCGGDRDQQKRPLMGKIACELANLSIITDDNPRNEDPQAIRKQIIDGCNPEKIIEIAGRQNAIEKSLQMLQKGDILILAGKGHEKHQIIKDEKIAFDEEKIVQTLLKK